MTNKETNKEINIEELRTHARLMLDKKNGRVCMVKISTKFGYEGGYDSAKEKKATYEYVDIEYLKASSNGDTFFDMFTSDGFMYDEKKIMERFEKIGRAEAAEKLGVNYDYVFPCERFPHTDDV